MIGLGDSGAHVMSVTNYTYPTDLLARLVRDEEKVSLEAAVHRLTAHPAHFLGIEDRGAVAAGGPADVCVIDLDNLALGPCGSSTTSRAAPAVFSAARSVTGSGSAAASRATRRQSR